MKKTILLIAVIAMMTGFTSRIFAQATVIGTTAGAVLVTPITLNETAPLHFGTMSVLATLAGTCDLSTTGTRTATGGVNLSALAPAATNAAYTVGGNPSATYAITLPATITVTSGTDNMTITPTARTVSAGVDGLTGTLDGGGADSFTIGGSLAVPAAQPTGTYAGTFDVTVAYN